MKKKLDNETIQLAFEDIQMICDNAQFDEEFSIYEEYLDKFDTIELALDELYERREMMQRLNEACEPHIIEDEVYKKAIEIIREMLDSHLLEKLNANSRKIFKDIFDNLSKEKQDLLKEVL